MTDEELLEQMMEVLAQTDSLMGFYRASAADKGIDPMFIRNMDGDFVMAPLILAKSSLLPAIAQLQNKINTIEAMEIAKTKFRETLGQFGEKDG